MAKDTIGFDFSEIPLEEAQSVVAAGDGKYSNLIVMLSSKLPEIELNNMNIPLRDRKGFAFGLPGGKEIEEKERRGLCHTVNLRMNKAGILWRVTYSGNKKLFICTPRKEKVKKGEKFTTRNAYNVSPDSAEKERRIRELKDAGMSLVKIGQTLGLSESAVHYHLYKKGDTAKPLAAPPKGGFSMPQLVELGRVVLNFPQPLPYSGIEGRDFRIAIAKVARKDLELGYRDIDIQLHQKKGTANFNVLHAKTDVSKQINLLRQALKQKGVIS